MSSCAMKCCAYVVILLLCDVMPFCAALCYAILCCFMLCYVMLCYVMLCYVMLCYVMLCCIMLCYVFVLCYVVLYYVVLCFCVRSFLYCIVLYSSIYIAPVNSHRQTGLVVLCHVVLVELCIIMLF